MERLKGPYNKCPLCGFETIEAKFCPFDGVELAHVGPERRCPHCTNVVWYAEAKFCGLCGRDL
jgi:hypothetical protein